MGRPDVRPPVPAPLPPTPAFFCCWHRCTPKHASHQANGVTVHRTAPSCTAMHRFRAAAIFYPNFDPNRPHSGIEMPYLLVTAVSWSGNPESGISLPSWSCGFDSHRPLSTRVVSRSVDYRVLAGSRRQTGSHYSADVSAASPARGDASSRLFKRGW